MIKDSNQLSQIEKLKLQKQKLEAKIQKAEALYKTKERKEETRRKVLVGACVLDKARKEGTFETIKHELNEFLKRNSDRILFDLPLLENETS